MSFSFDPALADDVSVVRFHIGDTNTDGHYLADETISALLTRTGSVGGAVLACIKFVITQLSQPDFRLDWLTVTNAAAAESFRKLLKEKALEFGMSASGVVAASTVSLPYRADSYQDSAEAGHDGAP